jgi:enediyne biosynthesis protein E4
MRFISLLVVLMSIFGCKSKDTSLKLPTLFQEISTTDSGLDFTNYVKNTPEFNIFIYRNFYNGGGVATGDINNDGLVDVYFTCNMGENQLFLNKGDMKFENISKKAGITGTKEWSTGVIMVDINNDGWLDIYVCNAGYVKGKDQKNELFINNHDLTFTEKAAEYNLDENGYTTHAAFFDYDQDGDLDCYILNNSFLPVNTLNYENKRTLYAQDWPVADFLKGGGDKLLRNDNGKFTDVTKQAGIYGSLIGFGLGVTVGDVNNDNLLDIYVSNDFFERDYLYINQGNGTYKEDLESQIDHNSLASMGADMADLNNDGYPEIFTTEMMASDEFRLKTNTVFEDYKVFQIKQQEDFYPQFMHNCLQLNNKNQTFSEIANFSGVGATDWSWGALMFDLDNDGFRDIFVCNGVYQDVINQDFVDFFANDLMQKMALTNEKTELDTLLKAMPSNPIPNKVFRNRGDLTFEDTGKKWGFEKPTFSNGSAYADFDNDGDLDLVINNVNQPALLYRNNAKSQNANHHLSVQLTGENPNTFAVGAKVFLHQGNQIINSELIPTRGFQSSVEYKMTFGLGSVATLDSLVVLWPNTKVTTIKNPPIDTLLQININTARNIKNKQKTKQNQNLYLKEIANTFNSHQENDFVDFYQEGLSFRMISKEGPKAAKGDVNNDGLEDIFICSAEGQKTPKLYLQTSNGFVASKQEAFELDSDYEDTAANFFDIDGDKDLDLFVGSGGNNKQPGSRLMQSRIYVNDGKGNFTINPKALTINGFNTSVALPFDFEGDGDLDLFVGSRSVPGTYGVPPRHFLYQNDGKGNFKDIAKNVAPNLQSIGMITDATLTNLTGDATPELVLVGEWNTPHIFSISNGKLDKVNSNLDDFAGWWYAVQSDDVDGDGDQDLILGNRGDNFYFSGEKETPCKLWVWDFDNNGTVEKIMTRNIEGRDMPIPMKKELTSQLPSLKKKNLKHAQYAKKSIQDLFDPEIIKKAMVREGNYFKSAVAINEGNGKFKMIALPKEVQFSCIKAIWCGDLNKDGRKDLLMAGNDHGFMPQFSHLDASRGNTLINKGDGTFEYVENQNSGFSIRKEVRQLLDIKKGKERILVALVNNDKPQIFSFQK